MSSTEQHTTTAPPPPATVKKGLAVASLVLGILAAAGCLIPIVNVVSIVLAIIAIALGVVALLQAKKPGRGGKGLAITGIILSVVAIIGAILVNLVFGAAVGSVSDSIDQQAAADAEAATQFPGATADDVVGQAGETLTVGDVSVTTTGLTARTDDVLGGTYSCSTVTYVNGGSDPATFNTFDWSLQDPAGAARTVGIFGDNNLQSGDLAPSGTVTGDICFEGETSPGQSVLLYDGSLFGTERGAWLNTI